MFITVNLQPVQIKNKNAKNNKKGDRKNVSNRKNAIYSYKQWKGKGSRNSY
jgi:hypothetical protein